MANKKEALCLKHFRIMLVIVSVSFLNSCKPMYNSVYKKPVLVDTKPSKNVKKLHKKLFYISKVGFGIGQQDATAYGIGWKKADYPNLIKNDIHSVINDFPAVYGFDISKIELKNENNIDGVPFNTMRELIIDAYSKGGIITISWHADNPTSNGDSWDKTPSVKDIIGNGIYKNKYDTWVDNVAAYLKTLKYKGKKIPIIFRPFHEMNGAWFWWGDPNCTAADYQQLWKETAHLLRDKHKLHNLLYTYSPNKLNPNDDYLKYYPGDNYVDILGIDIYDFQDSNSYIKSVVSDLKLVKKIANEKNKLYAFTETGVHKVDGNNWFTQEIFPDKNWFSQVLYPVIENSGIAWILFWRNDNEDEQYMTYKGHKSENDFIEFAKQPKTLFLNDINKIKN